MAYESLKSVLMKTINWFAWICIVLGILILLQGIIQLIFGVAVIPADNFITVFQGASTFFLLAIVLFVYIIKCKYDKG